MIHDNSDILMTFAVAGLINADVDKPVQPMTAFRLKIVRRPGNTVSYGLPVNTHVV